MMPDRPRVLFVDDEARVVDALQRALRLHRARWDVVTATSGPAALQLLAASPFDVVVSDMRMPDMDGATLLSLVKERHPTTMRVILSGQTDAEAALRVLPVAHQFLHKPTETVALLEILSRMTATKEVLVDERVRAAVGALGALPTLPAIYTELLRIASMDDASAGELVRVVERDPAVVMKLLQVVNSAFFGRRRQICDVAGAVSYLGFETVRGLCLASGVLSALPICARRFDASAFHVRALAVALVARAVPATPIEKEVGFVAGMLHDIGRLVVASAMPDVYDATAAAAAAGGRSYEEEEERSGSCRHANVGAYLLDLWGLPYAVVEALVEQAAVDTARTGKLRSADAVWVARRLVEPGPDLGDSPEELAYLERLGLAPRLGELRALARELGSAS